MFLHGQPSPLVIACFSLTCSRQKGQHGKALSTVSTFGINWSRISSIVLFFSCPSELVASKPVSDDLSSSKERKGNSSSKTSLSLNIALICVIYRVLNRRCSLRDYKEVSGGPTATWDKKSVKVTELNV